MFDLETLSIDELEQLRDACNRRILEMRQTRGLALPDLLRLLEEVKVTLRDQGKEWYSLERWQWMEGEVRFWLNPKDQENYRTGWFSIDDLIAWCRESGAVLVEEEFDEEVDEGPIQDANGVQITWLPRSRSGESISEQDDTLSPHS
jgi:hypothetical protein